MFGEDPHLSKETIKDFVAPGEEIEKSIKVAEGMLGMTSERLILVSRPAEDEFDVEEVVFDKIEGLEYSINADSTNASYLTPLFFLFLACVTGAGYMYYTDLLYASAGFGGVAVLFLIGMIYDVISHSNVYEKAEFSTSDTAINVTLESPREEEVLDVTPLREFFRAVQSQQRE